MEARINYIKAAPEIYKRMLSIHEYLQSCGLEEKLLDLVYLRASQINGCAYCIDMHSKDLRVLGEPEQKLYLLNAWRESPGFSDRERAALEWTEALTLVSLDHVPDAVWTAVRPHFSEAELVDLTLLISAINAWNRFAIAFRKLPA